MSSILILIAHSFVAKANIVREQANARNLYNITAVLVLNGEILQDSDITTSVFNKFIDLDNLTKGIDWDVTLDFDDEKVIGVASATYGSETYNKSGSYS